jgi:hypothetical protein
MLQVDDGSSKHGLVETPISYVGSIVLLMNIFGRTIAICKYLEFYIAFTTDASALCCIMFNLSRYSFNFSQLFV